MYLKSKSAILFFLILALYPRHSFAKSVVDHEFNAALLLNIIKHVTWPIESPQDHKTICVYETGRVGFTLSELLTVKKINVDLHHNIDILDKRLFQCDLLYLDRQASKDLPIIIKKLLGRPTLTVSNISGFAEKGGIIEFQSVGSNVKIILNARNLERSQLSISRELRKLVKVIR